jgi:deoxyribodipyrimidine photo-lyase
MSAALWWIRRDLRLSDNPALTAALAHGAVVPVFVLDPAILDGRFHRHALARRAFLFGGLQALDADLRRRGSQLVITAGEPRAALGRILTAAAASAIYAAEDFTPYARRRDAAVARDMPLRLLPGVSVQHPTQVLSRQQTPYTIFTPFYRAWRALPLPAASDYRPAPTQIPLPRGLPRSVALPEWSNNPAFPPGEIEAQRRLARFLERSVSAYATRRDLPADAGTSELSPYLRFGMLAPRTAVLGALTQPAGGEGAATWLKELVWREFYLAVMYHFPHVLQTAFNPRFRAIPWRAAREDLSAWQQGRTGYPIIDACMRQLLTTGWMHNRGRMVVASFLAKDLLIDWRHGEQWFMDRLVDGDPAANNGGWQWAAGVGTDAAPYFRIFNPILQGEKFDPDGVFVRRYVPELAGMPRRYIHRPWEMPPGELALLGIKLGEHYPRPIVDRALVKVRTLAAYRASQNSVPE